MGVLRLRVVPNAKRSSVVGAHGDAVKVKVAAPAIEGKANGALVEFIAEKLGVNRREIALVGGEKSRDKLVQVEGMGTQEARALLLGKNEA